MVRAQISRRSVNLARPKRFELLTPRFVVWCSIQLSYGRFCAKRGPASAVAADGAIAKGSVRRWQGFGSGPRTKAGGERPIRSLATGRWADAGFGVAMRFGRPMK